MSHSPLREIIRSQTRESHRPFPSWRGYRSYRPLGHRTACSILAIGSVGVVILATSGLVVATYRALPASLQRHANSDDVFVLHDDTSRIHVRPDDQCGGSQEECSGDSEKDHTDFRHDLSRSDPNAQKLEVEASQNRCVIVYGKETHNAPLFLSVWPCKPGDEEWFRQMFLLIHGAIRAEFSKIRGEDLCLSASCEAGEQVRFWPCSEKRWVLIGTKNNTKNYTQNFTMHLHGEDGAFKLRPDCPEELCIDLSDRIFKFGHKAQSWYCRHMKSHPASFLHSEAELNEDEVFRKSLTRRDREDLVHLSVESGGAGEPCQVKPIDKALNQGLRAFESICPMSENGPLNIHLALPPGQQQRLQRSISSWLLWCSHSGCSCSRLDANESQIAASVKRDIRQIACGVLLVQAEPASRQCPAQLLDLNESMEGEPRCVDALAFATRLQGQQEAQRRYELRFFQVNVEGLHRKSVKTFEGYTVTNISGWCGVSSEVSQITAEASMDELHVDCEAGQKGAEMQLAVRRSDGQEEAPSHGTVWALTCMRQEYSSGPQSTCICRLADLGEDLFPEQVKLEPREESCGVIMLSTRARFDACPDHLRHLQHSIETGVDIDCSRGRTEAAKIASDPTARLLVRLKWVNFYRKEFIVDTAVKLGMSFFSTCSIFGAVFSITAWPAVTKQQQFMVMLSAQHALFGLPEDLLKFANKFTRIDGMIDVLKDSFGDFSGLLHWFQRHIRYLSPVRLFQSSQRVHEAALDDCAKRHLLPPLLECLFRHYWDPEREAPLGDVTERLKQNGGDDPCKLLHEKDPQDKDLNSKQARLEDGGWRAFNIRRSWAYAQKNFKWDIQQFKKVTKQSKAESVSLIVILFCPMLTAVHAFLVLKLFVQLLLQRACPRRQVVSDDVPQLRFSFLFCTLAELTMLPQWMAWMTVQWSRHRLACENPFTKLLLFLDSAGPLVLKILAGAVRPPVWLLSQIPPWRPDLPTSQIWAALALTFSCISVVLFWLVHLYIHKREWSLLQLHKLTNHYMDKSCRHVKTTEPIIPDLLHRESEGKAPVKGGIFTEDGSPVYDKDGNLDKVNTPSSQHQLHIEGAGPIRVFKLKHPDRLSLDGMCNEATFVLHLRPGETVTEKLSVRLSVCRGKELTQVLFEVKSTREIFPVTPGDVIPERWAVLQREMLLATWKQKLLDTTRARYLHWEVSNFDQPKRATLLFALEHEGDVPEPETLTAILQGDCWEVLGESCREAQALLKARYQSHKHTYTEDQVSEVSEYLAEEAAAKARQAQTQPLSTPWPEVDAASSEVKLQDEGLRFGWLSFRAAAAAVRGAPAVRQVAFAGEEEEITERSFLIRAEATSTGGDCKQLEVKESSEASSWKLTGELLGKVKRGDTFTLHVAGLPEVEKIESAELHWPFVNAWEAPNDPTDWLKATVQEFPQADVDKQPDAFTGRLEKPLVLLGGPRMTLYIDMRAQVHNKLCQKNHGSLPLSIPRENLDQPNLKAQSHIYASDRRSQYSPHCSKLFYAVLCFAKPWMVIVWKNRGAEQKAALARAAAAATAVASNGTLRNVTDNLTGNLSDDFIGNLTGNLGNGSGIVNAAMAAAVAAAVAGASNGTLFNATDNITGNQSDVLMGNNTGNLTDNVTNDTSIDVWAWALLGCDPDKAEDSTQVRVMFLAVMVVLLALPIGPLAFVDGEVWFSCENCRRCKDWPGEFVACMSNRMTAVVQDVKALVNIIRAGRRFELMTSSFVIENINYMKAKGDPTFEDAVKIAAKQATGGGLIGEATTVEEIFEPEHIQPDNPRITVYAEVKGGPGEVELAARSGLPGARLRRLQDPEQGCRPDPQTHSFRGIYARRPPGVSEDLAQQLSTMALAAAGPVATGYDVYEGEVDGTLSRHLGEEDSRKADLRPHEVNGLEFTRKSLLLTVQHAADFPLDCEALLQNLSEALRKVRTGEPSIRLILPQRQPQNGTGLLVLILAKHIGGIVVQLVLSLLVLYLSLVHAATWVQVVVPVIVFQVLWSVGVWLFPPIASGSLLKNSARELGEVVELILLLLHALGWMDPFTTSVQAISFWLVYCGVICVKYCQDKLTKYGENLGWFTKELSKWLSCSSLAREGWWFTTSRALRSWRISWYDRILDSDWWESTLVSLLFAVVALITLWLAEQHGNGLCSLAWTKGVAGKEIFGNKDIVVCGFWFLGLLLVAGARQSWYSWVKNLAVALITLWLAVALANGVYSRDEDKDSEDSDDDTIHDDSYDGAIWKGKVTLWVKVGVVCVFWCLGLLLVLGARRYWPSLMRILATTSFFVLDMLKQLMVTATAIYKKAAEKIKQILKRASSNPPSTTQDKVMLFDRGSVHVAEMQIYVYDGPSILPGRLVGQGGRSVHKQLYCTERAWASDRQLVLHTPLRLDLSDMTTHAAKSGQLVAVVQLVAFHDSPLGRTHEHDGAVTLWADPEKTLREQAGNCLTRLLRLFSTYGGDFGSPWKPARQILDDLFRGPSIGKPKREKNVYEDWDAMWSQCRLCNPELTGAGCWGGPLLHELHRPRGKLLHFVFMAEEVRGSSSLEPPLLQTHTLCERQRPPPAAVINQWKVRLVAKSGRKGLTVRLVDDGLIEVVQDPVALVAEHNWRNRDNPDVQVRRGDRIQRIGLLHDIRHSPRGDVHVDDLFEVGEAGDAFRGSLSWATVELEMRRVFDDRSRTVVYRTEAVTI